MLRAVVECGSYRQAGARFHVSHPAVHRQVRLLEAEIGQSIFRRSGRQVQMTVAGRRLLDLAGTIRQEVSSALIEIRNLKELEAGSVRVCTATTMLRFFLPAVLRRFRMEHPKVSVQVATATGRDIITEIVKRNLDLGIVFWPAELLDGNVPLAEELLYEEEFTLAVSEDHPLARRESVSVEDLQGVEFITYSQHSTLRRFIESRFRSAGIEIRWVLELENEETIVKMMEVGVGAAILSRQRALRDNIRHFPIRGLPLLCPVCLVYLKKACLSHAAQEFARVCREESQRYRPGFPV